MEHWGWPQWFFVTVYAINVLIHADLHGRVKTGKYSAPATIVASAIGIFILYKGGFF